LPDLGTLYDLAQLEDDERECYIRGALYSGQVVLLVGAQKTGKSYLLVQVGIHLCAGESWGNRLEIPKPRNVLYIQTEGSDYDLAERALPVSKSRQHAADRWFHYLPESLDLAGKDGAGDGVSFLEDSIRENNIEICMIDSLYTSMAGSVNNDEVMKSVRSTLVRLQRRFPKLAFVILHHEHRPLRDLRTMRIVAERENAYAGSWVLSAMSDQFWLLQRSRNQHISDEERRLFSQANTRRRDQPGEPKELDPFFITQDESGILVPEPFGLSDKLTQLMLWLQTNSWVSHDEFRQWCDANASKSSFYRYRTQLLKEDRIREQEENGQKGYIWNVD